MLHTQWMIRGAVKYASATESQVGKQVGVRLDETENIPVFEPGPGNTAAGVQAQFGKAQAILTVRKREGPGLACQARAAEVIATAPMPQA